MVLLFAKITEWVGFWNTVLRGCCFSDERFYSYLIVLCHYSYKFAVFFLCFLWLIWEREGGMNDGVPSTQKLSWCLFQHITYICSPVLLLPPQKAIWRTHDWMFALIRLQPRIFPLSKQFISKSVKLRACYQRQRNHPSSYLPSWNRHHVVCCRSGVLKERFDIKKLKLAALSAVIGNFKWNYLS